ncbi:hypothetical protein F5H01DRAFT_321604 [Linnemannia elongata]|nr:hypothetical protein F5H01DRAFT_321604 [Linnemannia elongata]
MNGTYVKREPKDDGSSTVLSSISKKDNTKAKSRTEKKKRSRGAASGNASGSDDTNDPDPRTLGSDSNDDSDDDDEGDSDVYEVEKVVGHRYDQNNKLSYHIKWKDYPDEESSWEQESSVFCLDMVKEYWKLYCDQGGSGKTTILSTTTKLAKVTPETQRGATVTTTASALGSTTTTTTEQQQQSLDTSLPRRLTSVGPVLITEENWEPPSHWDSWDDLVERVEAIETRSADKHDRSTMFVHLRWKSGNRMTLHPLQEIHDKAPRRLIDFYESHLQFQESK